MSPSFRRCATLLALAAAALASACSDVTGPKSTPKAECTIYQGSNNCQG